MANSDSSTDPSVSPDEDPSRRDVILLGAGAFAGIGAAAVMWPLLDQMNPDASTLSLASIEVDLAPVEEGQAITVMWRGKPIFIRHRTAKEVEEAKDVPVSELPDPAARNANLADDALASDANRGGSSTDPDSAGPAAGGEGEGASREPWLVMVGICTHLGCIPQGQTPGSNKGAYGGWYCPCHGSEYDTAGRIRKGPAPENMPIPPYDFVSDSKIKIG